MTFGLYCHNYIIQPEGDFDPGLGAIDPPLDPELVLYIDGNSDWGQTIRGISSNYEQGGANVALTRGNHTVSNWYSTDSGKAGTWIEVLSTAWVFSGTEMPTPLDADTKWTNFRWAGSRLFGNSFDLSPGRDGYYLYSDDFGVTWTQFWMGSTDSTGDRVQRYNLAMHVANGTIYAGGRCQVPGPFSNDGALASKSTSAITSAGEISFSDRFTTLYDVRPIDGGYIGVGQWTTGDSGRGILYSTKDGTADFFSGFPSTYYRFMGGDNLSNNSVIIPLLEVTDLTPSYRTALGGVTDMSWSNLAEYTFPTFGGFATSGKLKDMWYSSEAGWAAIWCPSDSVNVSTLYVCRSEDGINWDYFPMNTPSTNPNLTFDVNNKMFLEYTNDGYWLLLYVTSNTNGIYNDKTVVLRFRMSAGGGGGGATYPVDPTIDSDLKDYIDSLAPDIFYMLDDAGPSDTGSVIDRGTVGYVNQLINPSGYSLGVPGVVGDGGTALEFLDGLAELRTTDVVSDDHYAVLILNLESIVDDTVFYTSGDFELSFESGVIRLNGKASSLGSTTKFVILEHNGNSLNLYYSSLTPEVSRTTEDLALYQHELKGEGAIIDWYVLIDRANVNLADLITRLLEEFGTVPYDNNTGVPYVDVTPADGGDILSGAQPENQLAPFAWHIDDTGYGIFFVSGAPSLMYITNDYGDSWTGPFDKSAQLEPRLGPTDLVVVGGLRKSGNTYAMVTTYNSNRATDMATSTDGGNTWNTWSAQFYGWGVDIRGSTLMYTARNASSGGLGVTYVTTDPTDGSPGATEDNSGNTTNGAGAIFAGDGSIAYNFYQDNSRSKFSFSPFTGTYTDINPNSSKTLPGQMAVVPGDSRVWMSDQVLVAGGGVTMAITQTDHLGFAAANFRSGSIGYQSSSGSLLRSFSFNTSDNGNTRKIHFEHSSVVSQNAADFDDKFWMSLGPGAGGLGNTHNHSFDGDRTRILGAGPYWFVSFVRDSDGLTTDQNDLRLHRFVWPNTTEIDVPEPPPDPTPGTGNEILRIKAEPPLVLDTLVDGRGYVYYLIGNEADPADAVGLLYVQQPNQVSVGRESNGAVRSVSRSLATNQWRPFHGPIWFNHQDINLSTRDITFEFWFKPTSSTAELFTSMSFSNVAGKYYEYGGMKCRVVNTGSGAQVEFIVGHDEGTARFQRSNSSINYPLYLQERWADEMALNDWNHFAMVRRNTNEWLFFLNGKLPVQKGGYGAVNRNTVIYQVPDFNYMRFGSWSRATNGDTWVAHYGAETIFDDIRFVVDEAEYTQEFTPRSGALP